MDDLARQLKVKTVHLTAWIQGVEAPPMEIFLKAVDIVTDRSIPSRVESPPGSEPDANAPKNE